MFQRFLRGILAQVCLDVINGDLEGFGREYVERSGLVGRGLRRGLWRDDSGRFGDESCVFFVRGSEEDECKY